MSRALVAKISCNWKNVSKFVKESELEYKMAQSAQPQEETTSSEELPLASDNVARIAEIRKPNLIIAGAQKSGTTWLHRALRDHPEFYTSVKKELNFFNKVDLYNNADALKEYLDNFERAGQQTYVAESTPHYLWVRENTEPYDPSSEPKTSGAFIKKVLPDAKIVFLLRDPVSRAVSAFHHHFAMGRLDATATIDEVGKQYGIIDIGHYARHLAYWKNIFTDNLYIYTYDELKSDAQQFLSHLFNDLGVEDQSEVIANQLAIAKINSKQNIKSRNDELVATEFPRVSLEQLKNLVRLYEPDIAYVEDYLSVDLSHWRDADSIHDSIVYK